MYQVHWVGPDKDTFYQEWKDEACQLHPVTKEKVWFNHAQVSCLVQKSHLRKLSLSMKINPFSTRCIILRFFIGQLSQLNCGMPLLASEISGSCFGVFSLPSLL